MATLITLKQIRDNIASATRETQVGSLIDTFINLSLQQIHNYHTWTWLRRKQTFDTVASQEDYNLDEEVDRIAVLRQRTSPTRLVYVPDELFYKLEPDPESTSASTPRYYRLWEETGFSTNLSSADTLIVVSSSTSDGSAFTVRITGRDSNGLVVTETVTLNGTTNVTTSTSFAASSLMSVSKSAVTTGTITLSRTTGGTVLSRLAPNDVAPRFKRLSLFPIPSDVITMYLEYYERLRPLVNDTDIAQMNSQWVWVAREGALAKMWTYKQNEAASALSQRNFEQGLAQMKVADSLNSDYVPVLEPWASVIHSTVRRTGDSVSDLRPSYALGF